MFRKLLKIAGFLVLVMFIIGTLAFTSSEGKNIPCREIQVSFNSHDEIQISKKAILRSVTKADSKILKEPLDEINADAIESEVEKIQAIQKAEVYKIIVKDTSSYKGVLVVKVKHRKPFVRIMSDTEDYFLDKKGFKIPASSDYAANVLVVSGHLSEKFAAEELLPFIRYIEEDDFWKAQIEQVYVEKDGDILLTPLVGDHIIEMGTLENYEGKLRKMMAFYEQVLTKNSWNKYKTISLKYDNQVIAKRN